MTRRYTSGQIRQILETAEAQDRERRRAETAMIVDHFKSGRLPTPEPVARAFAWRAGTDRRQLIRHHAFWKEWKVRCGFEALVASAEVAHLDLVRCEAALTAYANNREGFEGHIKQTVENPAQKEVMAFCAAYAGTVDTLRRIQGARADLTTEIDRLRRAATGKPEFAFILDLRRNLSHGSVTVPGWAVTSDFTTTAGLMKFSVDELLAFGSWNTISKGFLDEVPNGQLPISSVTGVCIGGLVRFKRELRDLFFRNRSPAEADYFDLQDLARKLNSRQVVKILLQGFLEKGTDPYPHLHRFFGPDMVRQILRYDPHTAEQVDFIIAQRSTETDCDEHLKSMLYRLFGVSTQTSPVCEPTPSLDPPPLGGRWQTPI